MPYVWFWLRITMTNRRTDYLELADFCASLRMNSFWRNKSILPFIISTSLGMKLTSSCTSRRGCLASFNIRSPSPMAERTETDELILLFTQQGWRQMVPMGDNSGLTYASGALADTWAKLRQTGQLVRFLSCETTYLMMTSRWAIWSSNASRTGVYVACINPFNSIYKLFREGSPHQRYQRSP